MRTLKLRHQFYLPQDLSDRLEQLSSRPGTSKTSILTDAFRAFLAQEGGEAIDRKLGGRLDRMDRRVGKIEHQLELMTEALGLFIQHQLTLVAHQPPFDPETARLGRERYRAFMELTGRRMARVESTLRLAPRSNADD